MADRDREWLAQVEVVCLDPFEAYRNGLKPHLAHATLVADPFHIVRLANRALDRARRRVRHEITGHRARRGGPLYDIRKILLTGCERLSEKGWAGMRSTLDRVDVGDVVVACWLAKENLREVYTVQPSMKPPSCSTRSSPSATKRSPPSSPPLRSCFAPGTPRS